jgi:ubiquinone/menaquinone biosynthesis C-methylase UbiE
MVNPPARDERLHRFWSDKASSYDQQMAYVERRFFADSRAWLCSRAAGSTLEVAIGTGLSLPCYATGLSLAAIEWSEPMLAIARQRAHTLGRSVDLRLRDARHLPWGDGEFDTVVSSFALCCIPDPAVALGEMTRALRPGGLLLLADHVESSSLPVRLVQRVVDLVTVPLHGEHYCHRPLRQVESMGYRLEAHDRLHLGIIESATMVPPMNPRVVVVTACPRPDGVLATEHPVRYDCVAYCGGHDS